MVYNVDLKKAKGPLGFGISFTLVGLLFLVIFGGIFISSTTKKNAMDSETKATNITWETHYDSEDGTTYSPNYEYEVDGTIYVCKSSTSSSIKSGDGTVYYDSSNPGDCMTDFDNTTNGFTFVFLIIPVIFIVVGVSQIRKSINKTKVAKELAKTGVLVKGLPYELVNSNVSVNNVPLKCMRVAYKFPDGITRDIRSEALKGRILSDADGCCDLLYDPNNYDNYFIDFEITTTGVGSPNIIYYQQTSSINSTTSNPDYIMNSIQANTGTNEYNPANKF